MSRNYRFGMVYQDEDSYIDYQIYKLCGLKFRGPQPNLAKPYYCFIGAAQTFGRYCFDAFPKLVCKDFNRECLNLGYGGADPSFFIDEELLSHVNKAELVFVQVMSARSSSNSLFTSHYGTRHGDVNGKYMIADDFWESVIKKNRLEIYDLVQETRATYVDNMVKLANLITVPKYLLWLSYREPNYDLCYDSVRDLTNDYPHFVNSDMVNCLVNYFDEFIECSSNEGIPHKVTNDVTNTYYPSPENHALMYIKIKDCIRRKKCKIY